MNAGLGFYLLTCCALVGWATFEFYRAMQPTQYPNPGVSAYEPPPPTLLGDRGFQVRSETALSSTAAAPADIEPEPKTIGEAAPKPDAAKKTDRAAATTGARRKRATPPDGAMAYGAQQSFGAYRPWGGYQPWGNQSWGNQRGYQSWGYQSRSNQSWSNQSWGSYRSSGSYQSQSGAQSRR